jgi:CheY-like chemotaxis protein
MSLKVLVVDDNRDAANSAAELLKQVECEVRVCFDGATALDEAANFHPDVCVLDLTMPRMDGTELAERLMEQEQQHPPKMVALTGRWDINSSHQTKNAGFTHHLVKPVEPNLFVEAVTGRKLDDF